MWNVQSLHLSHTMVPARIIELLTVCCIVVVLMVLGKEK